MIYYDEQKKGWAFDKLTELEHEKLMQMVEHHFINDLTYSMMKALQSRGMIPSDASSLQEDTEPMWGPSSKTAQ